MFDSNKLLMDEHPLLVLPELAILLGLNEAIVAQQIHYWVRDTRSGIEKEGERWIYNTYEQWQKQFPFWSISTIQRTFASLEKSGVLISEQFSAHKRDMKKYYRLDYEQLRMMHHVKMTSSNISKCDDVNRDYTENTNTSPGFTGNENESSLEFDHTDAEQYQHDLIAQKAKANADKLLEQLSITFHQEPYAAAFDGKGWRPIKTVKPEQIEKIELMVRTFGLDAWDKALEPALKSFKQTWAEAIGRSGPNAKHPGLAMIIDYAYKIAENEVERVKRNETLRSRAVDNGNRIVVNCNQGYPPGYRSEKDEDGYWFEILENGTTKHHYEDM